MTEYISKVQDEGTGKIAYFKDSKAREDIETLNTQFKENQINLIEDDTSMEGISDSEHDTLTTTNKKIIPAINEVNDKLKDIANNKADKNEVFSMGNMGQDIKEAMTGGSVAVVGKNTILTENIVDNQVTSEKIYLSYSPDVKIEENDLKVSTISGHLGGTVGGAITAYESKRCYLFLKISDINHKLKVYYEGHNGTTNFASGSNKIIFTNGTIINTSTYISGYTLSQIDAVPLNYIEKYDNDNNYFIFDPSKVDVEGATNIAFMFDSETNYYIHELIDTTETKKVIEWLDIDSDNLKTNIVSKKNLNTTLLDDIFNKSDKNRFRIALLSDLHYKGFENIQNYPSDKRVDIAIQSLNLEKEKNGLDFVIFNGDICNNDIDTENDIFSYIANYMSSKLNLRHFYLHASHDYYTEDEFENYFKYTKNYTIKFGNCLFVCIDNFMDSINTVTNSGFGYTPVDMNWFNKVIEDNKDVENIFIICHYLDTTVESDFLTKINSMSNIVCGFEGHIHDAITVTKGNYKFYRTGHFSVNAGGKWSNDNPWGYRILEFDGETMKTYMVYPSVTYHDYTQDYAISNSIILKTINKKYSEFIF